MSSSVAAASAMRPATSRRTVIAPPALAARRSARDRRAIQVSSTWDRRPMRRVRSRSCAPRADLAAAPTGPARLGSVARPARRASARAQASAAALAVPAAACGRTTKAASPIRQTRPKAIRGHLDVVDHLEEGARRLAVTTSARGPAAGPRPSARTSATWRSAAVPGGTESSRRWPSSSVSSSSRSLALQVVPVPDEVDQPPARRHRPVRSRDRVDQDVAVREHVVGDGVAERRAGCRLQLGLRHHAAPGHVAGIGRPHPRQQAGPGASSRPRRRTPGGRPDRRRPPGQVHLHRVPAVAHPVTSWPRW